MSERLKTATITFHYSHNYGAMLQAYAFQQFLFSLDVDNELINIRTPISREIHPVPSLKEYPIGRRLFHIFEIIARKKQYYLFEEFIKKELVVTKTEFRSVEEINEVSNSFDLVFAAGDQIWNPALKSFTSAFLLSPFNSRKVSFAVSMGDEPEKAVDNPAFHGSQYLFNFEKISVREQRSAQTLYEKFGLHTEVHIDTAFLLSSTTWNEKLLSSHKPNVPRRYILVYSPSYRPIYSKIGNDFASYLGCKALFTTTIPLKDRFHFKKIKVKQSIGPWGFLWILKQAEMVLCHSMHAVVFSILFHKPFYYIDENNDSSVHHLLTLFKMEERIISKTNYNDKYASIFNISFDFADKVIEKERLRSTSYIKSIIGTNN